MTRQGESKREGNKGSRKRLTDYFETGRGKELKRKREREGRGRR